MNPDPGNDRTVYFVNNSQNEPPGFVMHNNGYTETKVGPHFNWSTYKVVMVRTVNAQKRCIDMD